MGKALDIIDRQMSVGQVTESVLLAMAKNVNKLHNKIQKGKTGRHLFPLKSA